MQIGKWLPLMPARHCGQSTIHRPSALETSLGWWRSLVIDPEPSSRVLYAVEPFGLIAYSTLCLSALADSMAGSMACGAWPHRSQTNNRLESDDCMPRPVSTMSSRDTASPSRLLLGSNEGPCYLHARTR